MLTPRSISGLTLIELLIAIVLLALLTAIAMPAYSNWMLNLKVRNAAESIQNGLNMARTEAIRRNRNVRFQLVNNLTASCVLSASASNWVISLDDTTGLCNHAASATTAPRLIQKRASGDGSTFATVATINSNNTATSTNVIFDGQGQLVASATPITVINFDTSINASASRNLRLTIANPGGQIRLCDPNVSPQTDPRGC